MVDHVELVLIYVSTPIYVVLIGTEMVLSFLHGSNLYKLGDTITNVYLMLANMLVDFLMRTITLFVLLSVFDWKLITWTSHSWGYWLVLFLLEDVVFYWLHRVDHVVRLFWAVHVTHHSSKEYNLTTGFRSSVFQPVYRFVWFIPIVLLGFEPIDIFIMYSITQIYGILVHTKAVKRLGILELVLVTPSHHRVHHASNVEYLDKNMGMILIIWDKLFGTFQAEREDIKMEFGLYQKEIKRDAATIVFHEWKAIFSDVQSVSGARNRLNYLIQPPGWSPDGSTLTSSQLREAIAKNNTSIPSTKID
jgi:sterol desaturase/sphingolipid hydroxylase (fatty acid hydroxylase superfamily)